jgi:glycerol-3-phosphate dehydrogenase
MTGSALDLRNRRAGFAALEAETFDLLVIGGGITGAGVARDAALRGLRVALVEAADLGSGTSSRSSKLIHGGVRYLAQGDIGVVRQAANERRILRRIAPHLALTNPMVILARNKVGLKAFQAGLWSYEKLGHVDKHELHENWDADRLKAEEPAVSAEEFVGAVVYPEYLTEDSRLVVANARSAAAAGATVVTYGAARRLVFEAGRVVGAEVEATLPGETYGARVRARATINAAGPWVDAVRLMEDPQAPRRLQLTKGIHVVFARERLPINRTIVMNAVDRRGIFVVPRGRFVYFGTTDTFYPQASYWPEITPDDVRYLLDSAAPYFKTGRLKETDIVSAWAGIRPLIGEEGKKPSEISRKDEIMEGPAGLLSVAGGKLTSYRSMAEQVVDRFEKMAGRKPSSPPTDEEPLPGGDLDMTMEALRARLGSMGFSEDDAWRAAQLYGREALEVFRNETGPAVEAEHAVLCEGALTLEDYWVRRSARARFDDNGGVAVLEAAAERMAGLLDWSDEERRRQVEACLDRRRSELELLRSASGT